ncbi:hypothetical protein [Streptomyces sp. NPDC001296]
MPAPEDNSSLTTLQAHPEHPGHPSGQAAALAPDPLAHPAPATTAGTPPPPSTAPVPQPSHGLQTLGEYKGSGFTERRYIVRRGDGQVIQLSRLLYLVVASIDGVRDAETISHRVSGRYGAEVTTDNITHLVEHKLTPLGITLPLQGHPGQVAAPRSDLLLALRGHKVIFHEEHVARIAAALAWLHRPPLVAATLAGAAAMDIWLFAVHGAMTPVLQALEQPLWMLIIFALTVASLLFHEFGHASACRYSGAVPGKIGCGIFLIWPSMYTDVTDVYRIGKTGRLRTGLGGVYFNTIFMLALTAAYLLTGQPFLLAAVYLAHFEVLEQLMPALRLDGYYILGDLAGIPDLYGKIKPILLSLLPGHHPAATQAAAQVADLKRSARTIVTAWVLTMVPLLLAEAAYALWNLPRLLTTAARALHDQCLGTLAAFTDGHTATGLIGVIGTLMLLCPMAAGTYLTARLTGRLYRAATKASEGKPALRWALAATTAAACAALATAWIQGLTPQPLPEAAPVTPALQPGKPTPHTPKPTPTHPTTRHPTSATPRPSHPPQLPHATPTSPHTPTPTATPTATPPPPATGTPAPTTPPGTTPITPTTPASSASPSQTPTQPPTPPPTQPPPTPPSPPATAPSSPNHP